tara:strand:- start:285 stop:446 length:162 start_codon:yes stop_codon:yes gene_type:complete
MVRNMFKIFVLVSYTYMVGKLVKANRPPLASPPPKQNKRIGSKNYEEHNQERL